MVLLLVVAESFMPGPALNLAVFAVLAMGGAALLWPGSGLMARARRIWRMTERVRLEDVLKQMHKLEYERRPVTAASVAEGVRMRRQHAASFLRLLESKGFAMSPAGRFQLTEAGRAYALRIVRTHRLWERFLADRTGVRPEDWHDEAEAREHQLTESDADELALALGNPAYDPHGDPIPTAAGDIPAPSGVPLGTLKPGQHAVVTHVEDEPRDAYRELVAAGLGPMLRVERLEGPKGRVRFHLAGVKREVSAAAAANVTVEVRSQTPKRPWSATLADLALGRSAAVAGLSPLCRGPARRRLLDLGVLPGTVVGARFKAPGDGPVAYEVRGALVALRREQAAMVYVEDVAPSGDGP